MSPTPTQIRAARALLDWKQSELAQYAGLSLPSINNIERGIISPRAATLERIRRTLEEANIVFIGDSGVQLKKEIFEIEQYEGAHFIEKQNDDLFSCMRTPDDEALMCSLTSLEHIGQIAGLFPKPMTLEFNPG